MPIALEFDRFVTGGAKPRLAPASPRRRTVPDIGHDEFEALIGRKSRGSDKNGFG